ncbi:acyl-CoA thioesterase, partial [candidate division KSB1 bacterium]
ADTDQMGMVYHSKYLEWFECGRTELLREIGYPYSRLESEKIYLPVIEAMIKYRKPAQYDQLITVVTHIKEIPKSKFKIDYKIYDNGKNVLLAEGYTVHSFINDSKKPTRVPQKFRNTIEKYFNK